MDFIYRPGTIDDVVSLKSLGIRAWQQFEAKLTAESWLSLYSAVSDENTYTTLLKQSESIICVTGKNEIIGMAFLVPAGNPTDIYDKDWCYIRFVSVDPAFGGKGIGRRLTEMCIDQAIQKGERTIALHTSEVMDHARHIYESLGFRILTEIGERFGKRYWLYTLDLTKKDKTMS